MVHGRMTRQLNVRFMATKQVANSQNAHRVTCLDQCDKGANGAQTILKQKYGERRAG